MPRDQKESAEEFDDQLERPSKSAKKREMHALQALGEELVTLSSDRLLRIELPDELRSAIMAYQRFPKHEAKRRQMQYIGRLMRSVDPEPIRAVLDALSGASKAEAARLKRLEKLRDDFLADEQQAGKIVAAWPGADLQHLRTLRRNALTERDQNKPPRAYRELFRVLRELEQSHAAAEISNPEDL